MIIQTKRLWLKDFQESDYEFFSKLETDPLTFFYEKDHRPSEDEIKKHFHDILTLAKSDVRHKYSFIVINKEKDEPIGRVVIWQTDETIQEWEMGWYIYHHDTNKGYATEAAFALINFAFKTLKAHRIQALCNEKNRSSEKVMIKLGMQKEGTLREIRKLKNEWVNMLIYSILDSDIQD